MRIHFHNQLGPDGAKHGEHVIHTERAVWNQIPDPTAPNTKIDMIDFIRKLLANPALQAGTGWDQPSNHPAYPGKTQLQVVVAEIQAAHDAAALNALGM